MNHTNARRTARLAAIALLTIVIAGCQLQIDRPSSGSVGADKPAGQNLTDKNIRSDSPQKTFNNEGGEASSIVNPFQEDQGSTIADAKMASSDGATVSATAKSEGKWDPKSPKLHGIAIGESLKSLESSLGKPADSYSFQDEDEELAVHEYEGYSVGFGKDDKVKFVEVFDKDSSTGLNGLRVGDKDDKAVKLVGKPDTHTSSVIAYKMSNAMLKLDIDPENNTIISIKLFSNAG